MAGLVPAIHALSDRKGVDARHKAGHDAEDVAHACPRRREPRHRLRLDGVTGDATTRRRGMIRKLKGGRWRLYSRKKNPRTGKRRNLGTFDSKKAAQKHERAVQYFKRH
jgi:hypothetical protein